MSGQNERSTPAVMQYVNGETKVVWPATIKTIDAVIPLPKGHAFAR
jgi:branched-chain amino acid transport system substrate-binding protein